MKEEDFTRSPSGNCFVKKHVRAGLLPGILDELLKARKRAKKEMNATEDAVLKSVLNGRQLALKVRVRLSTHARQ